MNETAEKYISITGFKNYYGLKPLRIGYLVRCEKEEDNRFDGEAIRCAMPVLGTVGYVANSTNTVAGGTMSAGRIYDKVGRKFYVRVMFTTFTKVICRVEEGEPDELKKEIMSQFTEAWDEDDDGLPAKGGRHSAPFGEDWKVIYDDEDGFRIPSDSSENDEISF